MTIYGYYPNLGANAFFCAYFAIFLIANTFLTFRYKTWFYGLLLMLGAASEAAGYIGRILMHSNPWDSAGFQLQICTLIFAPVSPSPPLPFPFLPAPFLGRRTRH
jgi:hypothetical protein